MPTTINVTAQLYDSFIAAFGDEIIDLDTDQLYVALVTSSYMPNKASDTYWSAPQASEASGAGYTAGGSLLTGASWSGTVYSCDSPSWTSLTLSSIRYLVIYDKTSGTGPSSYRLVGYIDLGSAQNLSGQPLAITLPGRQLLTLLSGAEQITAVTVANITDAGTFGRELLTAADAPTARALLGSSWPFPVARNTFAAIGDSMAAAGSLGNENGRPAELQPYINPTTFQMLQVLTHQRLRYCGGNYAVSASKIAAQLNPQLGYVLAMNPLPGACFLVCGAAEMVENTGYNFDTCKGEIESMVSQLLAAGIVPILWTIPPASSAAFAVAPAVYRPQIQQWNAWIRLYADRNGFAVVDAYTALADVNGLYPSALTPDTLHPNAEGHKRIVIRALADGLAEIFPKNSLVHTIRSTDDLNNLLNDGAINQGLFTSDSNSDGIADGLTQSGTSTNTLVAPVPTDQLLGNWQQITVAAGNTGALYKNFTGWSVGDRLAVAARVQTSNMVASTGIFSLGVQASIPGGLTLSDSTSVTTLFNGIGNWPSADLTDGEVYVEFTVPAGTTQLSFQGSISSVTSGSATLRFGEATVRNLTTGDLLA